MPATQDFEVWLGNSFQAALRFVDDAGDPVNLTGATLKFSVGWVGGDGLPATLTKTSGVDADIAIVDAVDGRVDLALTIAETRTLPLGRLAAYEVEARVGSTETTYLSGFLIGAGGTNSDA